jgi:hypothetical protein
LSRVVVVVVGQSLAAVVLVDLELAQAWLLRLVLVTQLPSVLVVEAALAHLMLTAQMALIPYSVPLPARVVVAEVVFIPHRKPVKMVGLAVVVAVREAQQVRVIRRLFLQAKGLMAVLGERDRKMAGLAAAALPAQVV